MLRLGFFRHNYNFVLYIDKIYIVVYTNFDKLYMYSEVL